MDTFKLLTKITAAIILLIGFGAAKAAPTSIYLFDQLDQSEREIRAQSQHALASFGAMPGKPSEVAREMVVTLQMQWLSLGRVADSDGLDKESPHETVPSL